MSPRQRILLIDSHAICYRVFYAVKELRNSKGQPTNAVFGVVNIVRKLLAAYEPFYVAACFDAGRRTKRQDKFAEYKAQRSAMPEDLIVQLPIIKEVFKGFRIPVFEQEGYEADDIIAALVARFTGMSCEVIIASDDKDMHQLLGPGVRIYNSRKDALLGPDDTVKRFGVRPDQMVDYLALAGDASDNIPGVSGIGEVSARKLMEEFGSLDYLFKNTDKLKGKLKEKIEQGRTAALMSRELATLDTTVAIDIDLESLAWKGPDNARLRELFAELEFRNLLGSLKEEGPVQPLPAAFHCEPTDDLAQVIREAREAGALAFLFDGKGVTFAVSAGGAVFTGTMGVPDLLRDVLDGTEVRKIFYDSKTARRQLLDLGFTVSGEVSDVLLCGYLLNAGRAAFDISTLAWAFLKRVIPDEGRLIREVRSLFDLEKPLFEALRQDGLDKLYDEMELPLSQVLLAMETEGVCLDRDLLSRLSRDSDAAMQTMAQRLYGLAGGTFNLNSPKQLSVVLFEKLGLPVIKRTKTGPSTDEEVLTRLAVRNELPALILEYRQLSKLKSTYIDALPKLMDPQTGRIHCSFNQAVAETGRLSSSHPNLQNIPVRTPEGRMIRKAFISSGKENVLLSADYSQIELRVLAHLADEPNLKKAFAAGEDIHRYTAGLMFDVAPGDVTNDMRYSAKRINFGIVYGMSAFGLAKDLGIAQKEAQEFIDRYFLRYPGIRTFMDQEIAGARNRGYVETFFHRRRYLPEINSRNQAVRQFAERQAINTPVQGTAADIIKMAMVRLAGKIVPEKFSGKMIITVHDELVFDVPVKELEVMVGVVRTTMEQAVSLSVPMAVSVKYGPHWAEMKEL